MTYNVFGGTLSLTQSINQLIQYYRTVPPSFRHNLVNMRVMYIHTNFEAVLAAMICRNLVNGHTHTRADSLLTGYTTVSANDALQREVLQHLPSGGKTKTKTNAKLKHSDSWTPVDVTAKKRPAEK